MLEQFMIWVATQLHGMNGFTLVLFAVAFMLLARVISDRGNADDD